MGEVLSGIELAALPLKKTDHLCADCGEHIAYMDEVFLLQVVRPIHYEGRTLYCDVLDEHHPEEGFLYEPYYFCYACWENNYGGVQKDMSDELPVDDVHSRYECVCCASGIRERELAGTFTLGEFRLSERAPNGIPSAHFTAISNPDMLCLYCLTILNEGYIDMWQYLSENYECNDCVQLRCWRGVECSCYCHHEPPEEVEEDPFPFQSYT